MNCVKSLPASAPLVLLLLSVTGCAEMYPKPQVVPARKASSDGYLSVSVRPGQGGSCGGTPCRIYYRTPESDGEVKVVVNNFVVGTFPGGRVVDLGDYSETSVRISAPGTGAPVTYVNMPADVR